MQLFEKIPAACALRTAAADLTAATYARRGLNVLGQTTVVHRCKGWIGFWLTGAFVSVVPGLNVLFLPVFVTGATLMVLESEKATMEVPSPEAGTVGALRVKLNDKVSQEALSIEWRINALG